MTGEALVVAIALLADVAAGDPPGAWHPVAWIGRAIDAGRARLAHGSRWQLRAAGALLVAVITGLAVLAGVVVTRAGSALGVAGLLIESVVLKMTLSIRGLTRAAGTVEAHLGSGDLPAARAAVGRHLVSRSTGDLDAPHVASAAIESVAENFTDAVVAPLVFYLVFGLPGAFAYRAINTADAMLGYREGLLEDFGKVAARADDVANLLPARLAGALLALSARAGAGCSDAAWRAMRREHGRTASPNAGWTIAAMAGALGVTLEKPGAYRLGDGPLPTASDIRRARRIFAAATAVLTLLTLAAALA